MSEKSCFRCYMDLPLEAFGTRQGKPSSVCKSCEVERIRYWKHGMTSIQRDDRADDQDGCAICGRTTPGRKGWVVDHDHACCPNDASCASCRRGLLCQWCNTALGYAQNSPTILRRMADYLELRTLIADATRTSETESRIHTDVTDKTDVRSE